MRAELADSAEREQLGCGQAGRDADRFSKRAEIDDNGRLEKSECDSEKKKTEDRALYGRLMGLTAVATGVTATTAAADRRSRTAAAAHAATANAGSALD
jgi:hypothetical protein